MWLIWIYCTESSLANETKLVVESFVVSTSRVLEMDSQDRDVGGSTMGPPDLIKT